MPEPPDPSETDFDLIRAAVLEAARVLLEREGPDAVTNRKVAREAGCSTMAIYSRFGSKGGILDALYLEGVERLAAAQARVPTVGSGLDEVFGLCLAYRGIGLESPGHYRIVFGDIPGWRPSESLRQHLLRRFERLVAAVARAIAEGSVHGEALPLAFCLFATCHGCVSLQHAEYTGLLPDAERAYLGAVARVLGVTPPERG